MKKWETGEKQNYEEFHNLYSSPNAIRLGQVANDETGGLCSRNESDCRQGFGGKARRKTTKRTPRLSWRIILKLISEK
jgi:hypothetical protein